jgi:carbonic anhydrase
MSKIKLDPARSVGQDLTAGMVVFLVALPLCLGIALASNAPLFSGVVSGIVGGILVGLVSGSHTSVSGPGNTLMALIAAQILVLGSFQAFLLAVVVAGVIQVLFGIARVGFLSEFFPSSVIKGLLAAIGVILVLKQVPHLLGRDTDPEGDMAFEQPDHENTFTEFGATLWDMHLGAAVIGIASVLLLVLWDRIRWLKKCPIPASLAVVLFGLGTSQLFKLIGGRWLIGEKHLVQVPVAENFAGFLQFFQSPDFSQWMNPAVYSAGLMIALVASLETLLNLEAVDKIDPQQRTSSSNRELIAQGVGNIAAGMLGGIPVTSVIVRSSININAGSQTKLATIFHGLLLLFSVMLLPTWLNQIPLSCLAAILLVTGAKLASPAIVRQMWSDGKYQFAPFAITVVAIVLTDLLVGILIGLGVALSFILYSNFRRPIRRFVEKHLGGNVLHVELANQVSFLNRAALDRTLDSIPRGGQLLLDARYSDYIDPDVLDLIRHFKDRKAPARKIAVSLIGFRSKYQLHDEIQYVDYSTRELQSAITPQQVLQILKDGHERFRTGRKLTRDWGRQVHVTAQGQHPLAVVLSCMDSRSSAELIFDAGVGDVFSLRVAGNILSRKVLGSLEYGCAVAGAKLILIMGHTRCGAVTTAVNMACSNQPVASATGCQHVEYILQDIQESIDPSACRMLQQMPKERQESFIDDVARLNVLRSVRLIEEESETLRNLIQTGRVAVVGAMYDVSTGDITFLQEDAAADSLTPDANETPV